MSQKQHFDRDWETRLSPEVYRTLRKKETEKPFTGQYWNHFAEGEYRCAGCDTPLFDSSSKFESYSGWPSFFHPININIIETRSDQSYGMFRTEILCKNCGGHLGHVFRDGSVSHPFRYCVNSTALQFHSRDQKTQ